MVVARKKIVVVGGTRPEAIKLAPIVRSLRNRDDIRCIYLSTGQHPDLFELACSQLEVFPDENLTEVGRLNNLDSLHTKILSSVGYYLDTIKPDAVMVLGDTASGYSGALAAFHRKIPIYYAEAGLRSDDKHSPFPEEMYRRMITDLANTLFAVSNSAKKNLLKEGVATRDIHVVGSSFIESFNEILIKSETQKSFLKNKNDKQWEFFNDENTFKILLTCHRRENIKNGIVEICKAARAIARKLEDTKVVLPYHPNPEVHAIVRDKLEGRKNIKIISALDYADMAWLLTRVDLLITDSGGLLEEASLLGLPTIVARQRTEREDLVAGSVVRIPPDLKKIYAHAKELHAKRRVRKPNRNHPYGKGNTSVKISDIICETI